MAESSDRTPEYFQWRATNPLKNNRWHTLRWRMTEEDAAKYATREGVQIEKVEGSGVTYPKITHESWASNIQRDGPK